MFKISSDQHLSSSVCLYSHTCVLSESEWIGESVAPCMWLLDAHCHQLDQLHCLQASAHWRPQHPVKSITNYWCGKLGWQREQAPWTRPQHCSNLLMTYYSWELIGSIKINRFWLDKLWSIGEITHFVQKLVRHMFYPSWHLYEGFCPDSWLIKINSA